MRGTCIFTGLGRKARLKAGAEKSVFVGINGCGFGWLGVYSAGSLEKMIVH